MVCVRSIPLLCALALLPCRVPAQATTAPAPRTPAVPTTGTPVPLLSVDALHFLEGTWTATSRDGKEVLGTYTFVRELNGHVLARHSSAAPDCDPATPTCSRQDIFYVFQNSPGAPLEAIDLDSEGHVLHYFVDLAIDASTSTLGRRDLVAFTSDPTQLGPRVRLRYEHNIDTQTGKDTLSGAFDILQPDGAWHPVQQWYGTRK